MGGVPISSSAEIEAALQSTLQDSIDAGVLGLSAAISTSRSIIWQSTAGFADLSAKSPITNKRIFGIGSIAKVFVAVVILACR
jgi:D-alanyl-D-alanine carboxypeptidase